MGNGPCREVRTGMTPWRGSVQTSGHSWPWRGTEKEGTIMDTDMMDFLSESAIKAIFRGNKVTNKLQNRKSSLAGLEFLGDVSPHLRVSLYNHPSIPADFVQRAPVALLQAQNREMARSYQGLE